MKTKPSSVTPPGRIRVPRRVRVRIEGGSFKVRVLKQKKKTRKILDLARHPEYQDWLTRGEATAHLQRGLDALNRLQHQGRIRQVTVFEYDPRRHHVRFHPGDIADAAKILRERDDERAANARRLRRRDTILQDLVRLPGPNDSLLRKKKL